MKVTEKQVLAAVVKETYTVLPDGRTTICQITMPNGFTVGGHSACVDAKEYNEELGNKYAKEEALKKVWGYLGYDLATKMMGTPVGSVPKVRGGMAGHARVQTYVGTKVLHATPMGRGEYDRLRGWTVPENENPHDAGYMVEYTDGGAPNVPGYEGYISWSPKDVFEGTYKPVVVVQESFKDRLKKEEVELFDKLMKLRSFITTQAFSALPSLDQSDLREQEHCMANYHWVLTRRLKRLNNESL